MSAPVCHGMASRRWWQAGSDWWCRSLAQVGTVGGRQAGPGADSERAWRAALLDVPINLDFLVFLSQVHFVN
jgi:hypothetical protein